MAPRSSWRFCTGFTLTEVLVVIGVIGMLVGLVVPAFATFRADARGTRHTG